MKLSDKKCIPCEVGGVPLTGDEIAFYIKDTPEWKADEAGKKISRTFKLKGFNGALEFVNKVGFVAEKEGHHPDITIHYNAVTLDLWTHAVGGLSVNDFILAAKIDLIQK
jgi:4a-hydroxytetrahydrobiopterin dehydratase